MRISRSHRIPPALPTLLVSFATMALVAGLVLPSASAGAPALARTVVPPYKGTTYATYDGATPLSPTACNAARTPLVPSWRPSSGLVRLAASASAHTSTACPSGVLDYVASADGGVTIAVPLGHPGLPTRNNSTVLTLTVNLSFDLSASWAITHGACPRSTAYASTCDVEAAVDVTENAQLVDDATGVLAGSTPTTYLMGNLSEWERSESCYGSICTITTTTAGPAHGALAMNASANLYLGGLYLYANHNYTLELSFATEVQALAFASSPWSAKATAALDLGSSGHGLWVNSITLS